MSEQMVHIRLDSSNFAVVPADYSGILRVGLDCGVTHLVELHLGAVLSHTVHGTQALGTGTTNGLL